MSFRFRRRLRIAPGIYLNFSRSGISTSIGRRGASLTLGARGAYVNVGIPGSGLSYRGRIDHSYGVKKTKPSQDKCVPYMYPSEKEYLKQVSNQQKCPQPIPHPKHNGVTAIILGIIPLFIAISGCFVQPIELKYIIPFASLGIILLIIGTVRASKYTEVNTTNIDELIRLNKILANTTDLSDFHGQLLLEQKKFLELSIQIDTNNAAIRKLQKKRQTTKRKAIIEKLQMQNNKFKEQLSQCGLEADWELTSQQKETYQRLCAKFAKLKDIDGIWKKLSDLSYCTVKNIEDKFCILLSREKVPTLVTGTEVIYFYPKYIIKAESNLHFKIIDWKDITMTVSKVSSPIAHIDANKYVDVKTSFWHETKDGLPDKRYGCNPKNTVVNIGQLHISGIDMTFFFNDIKQCNIIYRAMLHYIDAINNHPIPSTLTDYVWEVNYVDEPYYADIAQYIVTKKDNAISHITKTFHLGYEKAINMVNDMSKNGIVPGMSITAFHAKLKELGLASEHEVQNNNPS